MKIEITILSAPIRGSVIPTSPMVAEIGGIGTLVVNNYYNEGEAGGYTLTDADKAAIAALAAYDDTELRSLIEQGDIDVAEYFDSSIDQVYIDMDVINQRSLQNFTAIGTLSDSLGSISTVLDAINGEVV